MRRLLLCRADTCCHRRRPASAALTTVRCAFSATTTPLRAASGSRKKIASPKSADAFLAGLRSLATPVTATTAAIRSAAASAAGENDASTQPGPVRSRVVKVASVEELLADDDVDDGVEETWAGGASASSLHVALLPPPPESMDREAAFYGTSSGDASRTDSERESLLTATPPSSSSAEDHTDDGVQEETREEDATMEDDQAEDVDENEEDDLLESIADVDALPGEERPITEGEGTAAADSPSAYFEGDGARAALEEALEAMALLEEEEEAAALAASRHASTMAAAPAQGEGTRPMAPSTSAQDGAREKESTFFGASADDISAAKESMESGAKGNRGSNHSNKEGTRGRAGGSSTRGAFDEDRTVAFAEMESMGEALRSPDR